MTRSSILGSMLLALVPSVHAAQWELSRPGSATTIHPAIHDTEIMGTNIGCVTLTRGEMRSFGYPGHAVFCEEATAGEVVGAVVDRKGRALCDIFGFYNADVACYDLSICNDPIRLCRR